jgi:hypothetical protein
MQDAILTFIYQTLNYVFFPPNTTSLTQPMDQGVIQNFKVQYRKHVLHSICGNMGGNCNSVTELSTKISVLDAVRGYLMQKKNTNCVQNSF